MNGDSRQRLVVVVPENHIRLNLVEEVVACRPVSQIVVEGNVRNVLACEEPAGFRDGLAPNPTVGRRPRSSSQTFTFASLPELTQDERSGHGFWETPETDPQGSVVA